MEPCLVRGGKPPRQRRGPRRLANGNSVLCAENSEIRGVLWRDRMGSPPMWHKQTGVATAGFLGCLEERAPPPVH
jgi:hypothetical protein